MFLGNGLTVALLRNMEKPTVRGKCCNFGGAWKYLTDRKYCTECNSDRNQSRCQDTVNILKQIVILRVASALNFRVKYCTILHSGWTVVVLREKIVFVCVIRLINCIDGDKQIITADSLDFHEVINLSQAFFRFYNHTINLYCHVLSEI